MQLCSKNRSITGKTVNILLLTLFLGYYSSITFFTHSHIVNGVTIVHSHPYKSTGSSDQSGNAHSDKELLVIQFLSEYFTTAAVILFSAMIFRSLLYKILVHSAESGFLNISYLSYTLRAPPALLRYRK